MANRIDWVFALVLSSAAVAGTARAQEEPGPRDAHKALQLSTAGSLIVTSTLGTLVAINQPTLFSNGRCATKHPLLGDYGCKGLSALHGISALVSIVLFTATTTLEFAEFDWPGRDQHNTAYEVAAYVPLVGMALQPIGGIIAAMPGVLGIKPGGEFSRVMRTIHLITGYTIAGTYVALAAVEL